MADAGFRIVSLVAHPDEPPGPEFAGHIAAQIPAGGSQAAKGTPVTLTVYGQYNRVPDIVGRTPDEARGLAAVSKMTAVQTGVNSGNTPIHKNFDGRVASQAPLARSEIPADRRTPGRFAVQLILVDEPYGKMLWGK